MNYEINFENFMKTSLIYNETQSEAYRNLSNDTQSVVIKVSKKINDNVNINFESNLDVKNNYDPYKGIFNLSLFDECSQLDISYTSTRFNDDFNTQPKKKLALLIVWIILVSFGYEQSTDLFFKEPQNYGF